VTKALDDLVDLLDLEPIEVNIFRGVSPDDERQRVFGGQVAGQALVAAARTVGGDRPVHSLHAYFLRPGDPTVPILYEVDRIRTGARSPPAASWPSSTARPIFNLQASFHTVEAGLDHQVPMPEVPPPTSLPTFAERYAPYAERMGDWMRRPRPSTPATCSPSASARRASSSRSPASASRCGSGPTATCPTTRCCTPASSPTRAT
jgi:acyl-CoA thioesterase-2